MEALKRRIIFTVTNDLSYDQRMMRISSALVRAGYDVTLVGRKRKISGPLPDMVYKQVRIPCIFDKGKLFYIEYQVRLFFYLLFRSADIHGAVDLDTLLPVTLAAKIRSRQVTFDAHEYFTEVPELVNRKLIKRIWGFVGKICIPHAHLCYTVSQSLADIFTEAYGKKFEVIRNLPYRDKGGASHEPGKVIFYQGDLNEGRGLEQAIEAMEGLDAELIIAGSGPIERQLHALAAKNPRIRFLGYVCPEELRRITADADIGLNLLENKGLSYYYSLSNKFFNYISAGIPQLCADFPEYRLINEKHEVAVLVSLEKDNLRVAMQRLLQDRELYQRLKSNCKAAAEVFNWESEERHLIKCYDELR